uniref:Caspase recruitment domain family member 10 n=1 Tax=Chelydra serpentina TaxID=8475 RepID=A0A8C3T7E8_CHESE
LPGANAPGEADSPAEEEEEVLWEKIESARHQLTRSLNPAKLTPYLRQCRVIDEQDEEEVLSSCRFPYKSNRTGHLMDILRNRGKRGYEAFLESLEFYYPEHFTQLTGREPVQRCSMILDEEGPEGLTQFLMLEVKKVRAQRKEHLVREHQLKVKNQALEEEQTRLGQQLQELLKVQERCQRLREEWDSNSMELLRLKDENYMLAMRYAQLCEEKNLAVLRSRDLQLLVDQLKCKVSSLEEECRLLRKHKSTGPQREAEERGQPDMVSELQAENQRLTASLQELQSMLQAASEAQAPGSQRILLDILEHDWNEAQDERQELCQKLHSVQSELQWAEELRDKYLQEVEDLQLKHRTLQKDCDLYKHRMNTVLSQLEEIEKERDQAIQSRDRVQLQYSQSLVEKDQYRKRVRALEEERDELRSKFSQVEGVESTLEAQLPQCQGNRDVCTSSYSLCSNLSSTWSLSDNPSSLGNGVMDTLGVPEVTPESEKDINRLSTFPFPPCAGSILRRQRENESVPFKRAEGWAALAVWGGGESGGAGRAGCVGRGRLLALVHSPTCLPDPDRSPKPYSVVRPLVVQAPRPVVLSPECIAPRLIRNLLDLPTSRLDFHLCPASEQEQSAATPSQENCMAPGSLQDQRKSRRIRTIRECIGKNKHCLLELGLQRVRDLIKSEIYPIIIHVEVTEKNVRGLRSLLRKPGQRDSDVVKLCRSAEQGLHALPCSWARVDAQSWCHAEELVKVVRRCVFQEQNRVVWVEAGEL